MNDEDQIAGLEDQITDLRTELDMANARIDELIGALEDVRELTDDASIKIRQVL